jgi:hypothetical protein
MVPEVLALLAVIEKAIDVYLLIAKDDEKVKEWRDVVQKIRLEEVIEKGLAMAEDLFQVVSDAVVVRQRERRAEAAADKNPYIRPRTIVAFVLLLLLPLGLLGCAGRGGYTENRERGYAAFEWPDYVSQDPSHYDTQLIDGRTITTAPFADAVWTSGTLTRRTR